MNPRRVFQYAIVGLALALALPSRPARAASLEARFLWDAANAALAAASEPEHFLRAAGLYRDLIERGARNGPLFYNYGTALLEAQRYEEAAAALMRAERYSGTNPDIRRNYRLALNAGTSGPITEITWYRLLLFWHFGLAATERMTVALLAFSALWVAWGMRLLGWKGPAARLALLAAIVLALFGTSTAATLHAESRDDRRMHTAAAAQPDARRPLATPNAGAER